MERRRIDRQNWSNSATPVHAQETKKDKGTLLWQLAIRPRRLIKIPFGMVGNLPEEVFFSSFIDIG